MALFKKKRIKEDPIDDRTVIEKRFEESGQKLGKVLGELTQKGVNKFHEVKGNLEEDGTLDRVRERTKEIRDKTQNVVDDILNKEKDE
jgi:ElaB/YqjD/DUF883 family membrane-anchored ribosome-binding protein